MNPIRPEAADPLRWVRTTERPEGFELRAGDDVVGHLRWPRHGASLAEAESAAGSWTLKRLGFLHPYVTVWTRTDAHEVARLDLHARRSLVSLAGRPFGFLDRAGYAIPAWNLIDLTGRPLLHLEPIAERVRLTGGLVHVGPEARVRPDLALLATLAWYPVVRGWAEEELAAGTAASLVAISD